MRRTVSLLKFLRLPFAVPELSNFGRGAKQEHGNPSSSSLSRSLDVRAYVKYFRCVKTVVFDLLNLRRGVICCLGAALFWLCQAGAADWLHAGFLYDDFQLTLDTGHRTEALGPLFYWDVQDTQRTLGVPPLFDDVRDPATDYHGYEIGYPVLTYRRFGTEWRWQLIQVLSWAGGQNTEEQNARRFTLFPIYFRQRSAEPGQNYTAVFPFYGHLKNRIFRDEIFFVMFPGYSETRKADMVTKNYVYPFYAVRHGNGLNGWQIWPFYGREHKDVTTKTNGFGDVETVGGHDSTFIAWPIYFNNLAGIGTENPERTRAVLPLYDIFRSPKRDSTTIIWPFFSHIIDRDKKYEEREMPWPLVVFAHGEGKTTRRVWPFFSHSRNQYLESDWYLWLVWKFNRAHIDPLDRTRMRLFYFLYSDTIQKNTETGSYQRLRAFWPLFTHKRDYNGNTRLQIFAPLEPILPNNRSVEREYSPLWSVWRSDNNPKVGASSQSLLWNLYRHENRPESKKCSLMFGLFQYQSGTEGKRVRLFYIPIVKTKPVASKSEVK